MAFAAIHAHQSGHLPIINPRLATPNFCNFKSQGDWTGAFQVFAAMRACGGALKPNAATFSTLITACSEGGHVNMVRVSPGGVVGFPKAPKGGPLVGGGGVVRVSGGSRHGRAWR